MLRIRVHPKGDHVYLDPRTIHAIRRTPNNEASIVLTSSDTYTALHSPPELVLGRTQALMDDMRVYDVETGEFVKLTRTGEDLI